MKRIYLTKISLAISLCNTLLLQRSNQKNAINNVHSELDCWLVKYILNTAAIKRLWQQLVFPVPRFLLFLLLPETQKTDTQQHDAYPETSRAALFELSQARSLYLNLMLITFSKYSVAVN